MNEEQELVERSLVVFKPDAVQRGIVGEILSRFERVGLKIVATKMVNPDRDHYFKHYEGIGQMVTRRGEEAFDRNLKYMTSGPVIAFVFEGVEAVAIIRKIVGTTEPKAADMGTIRGEGCMADVIFLTAADDTEFINRAQKLGFVDYLIKPFNYERFKTALVNYQKMRDLFRDNEKATQEQLDSMLHPGMPSESGRVTKGMHPKTLETIRRYLERSPADAVITQQELVEKLGLSRVTVRRYMEYLASINEVAVQMVYGTVGRPSYTYRKMGS